MAFSLDTFAVKPLELKQFLDRYVVGQERAKKVLATAMCGHYTLLRQREQHKGQHESQEELLKSNVLLIGPSGAGKTSLITKAAQYLAVQVVFGDATKLTATGIVGEDVDDFVRRLYGTTQGNIPEAEKGIIYIDEIDKVARHQGMIGHDFSGTAVQHALLKLLEGTTIEMRSRNELSAVTLATNKMLFVMSGAFDGLDKIIEKRRGHTVGFAKEVTEEKKQGEVTVDDLIQYGFDKQFLGRIAAITSVEALSEKQLYHILKLPVSPVITVRQQEFEGYGIRLDFDDTALQEVAAQAYAIGTGGRSLHAVLEQLLLDFRFQIPSTTVTELLITKEVVQEPAKYLEKLLRQKPARESKRTREIVQAPVQQTVVEFIWKPDLYRVALGEAGVERTYLSSAVRYGLDKKILPQEMPQVIGEFEKAVGEYTTKIAQEQQYRLTFDEEAKRIVIDRALLRRSTIQDVVENDVMLYVGSYTKDLAGREIVITHQAMINPKAFVKGLVQG